MNSFVKAGEAVPQLLWLQVSAIYAVQMYNIIENCPFCENYQDRLLIGLF